MQTCNHKLNRPFHGVHVLANCSFFIINTTGRDECMLMLIQKSTKFRLKRNKNISKISSQKNPNKIFIAMFNLGKVNMLVLILNCKVLMLCIH